MGVDGRVIVAIVGEDQAHRGLAMAFVDAALREAMADADWFEPDQTRIWAARPDAPEAGVEQRYFVSKECPDRWPNLRARPNGVRMTPDAVLFRRAILWMIEQDPQPDLVVILADTGGREAVALGVQQAQAHHHEQNLALAVAIGAAHQDAEAWLLAGHVSDAAEGRSRLARAREVLSFDPAHEPQRLTAGPNDRPTDAKRVLRFVRLGEGADLAAGVPDSRPPSPDEMAALFRAAPLDLTKLARFEACGLTAFIRALRAAVARAFRDHLPGP